MPSGAQTTAPENIASARASSGNAAKRRSNTLFRPKHRPATSASQSAADAGTGMITCPSPSTSTAPPKASTTRATACDVMASCSNQRASSTTHIGIR